MSDNTDFLQIKPSILPYFIIQEIEKPDKQYLGLLISSIRIRVYCYNNHRNMISNSTGIDLMSSPAPLAAMPPIPGLRGLPLRNRQLNLLRFLLNPINNLNTIHERFGLFGAMQKDDPSLVFAFGPDYNQQVLSDPQHFYNFSTLPFKMPDDAAFYKNIDGLISMNGDRHDD
jgi:hypothetical protein